MRTKGFRTSPQMKNAEFKKLVLGQVLRVVYGSEQVLKYRPLFRGLIIPVKIYPDSAICHVVTKEENFDSFLGPSTTLHADSIREVTQISMDDLPLYMGDKIKTGYFERLLKDNLKTILVRNKILHIHFGDHGG